MTENTTTDEYIYKYKSINEQSTDDINNSAILLKEYESFTQNDYYFIIGITDSSYIYIECKKNEKYYKKLLSRKTLTLINDKFQSCKNINEMYKLIISSINKKQINITTIKNNKIKFNLTLITEDNISSPFEIILKEEKSKNDLIINKVNKINISKNNDNNSDMQKENSESLFMEEELQYIKKELLSGKNNKRANPKNEDLNKENIENKNENNNINDENEKNVKNDIIDKNNIIDKNDISDKNKNMNEIEEEEEEEDEDFDDNDYSNEDNNIENENLKIINNINKLKREMIYIKNLINKNEQTNKDKKIKELELKNDKLLEEIKTIKN